MRIGFWVSILLPAAALGSASALADPPATVVWDGAHLADVRANRDQPEYEEILQRLRGRADLSLPRGPFSVMEKKPVPPSGDKHDYLSYARYWWPNPDTADGLPYINRDGHSNDQLVRQGDRGRVGAMGDAVETLALAGYLLDDKRYSDRATLLVRAWFLDPATRMNPHMKYGQGIPGVSDGRGWGILDTRNFIAVLDAVRLLEESDSWTEQDTTALTAWMTEYLHWLRTDPAGKEMQEISNNHGTWYDAQTAAIAIYVADRALAKKIVDDAKHARIARGIAPDGSQPEEITRTKSLSYCLFNLSALGVLARIGESVDVDLWGFETPDGRSIRGGLDFVTPPLLGEVEWKHEQIDRVRVGSGDAAVFCMAARRYGEPRYLEVLREGNRGREHRFGYTHLLFPSR